MGIRLKLLKFYQKNREILSEMVRVAQNREFTFRYESGAFGKRPFILQNEGDILELIKQKAISFHISEERWKDPMLLSPKMKKKELNELRIGWDFIIDIDGKDLELSRLALFEILKVLKDYNVESYSIKFSGGKGFHIAIPWEAFPKELDGKKTKDLFPDLARTLASFIAYKIKEPLEKKLLRNFSEEELIKKYNLDSFDVFKLVSIDTILISVRHLFRMPFSLNEKTNLLSIPLREEDIKYFEPSEASLDNYEWDGTKFLDTENVKEEITELIYSALAWEELQKLEKQKLEQLTREFIAEREREEIIEEIQKDKKKIKFPKKFDEKYFPPCIKKILQGLEDGRKRAVFILINFLKHVGWEWDEIKQLLEEWNERNPEPLRERYIEYQWEWHKKTWEEKKKQYLPPNCNNENYYKDMGVCEPDEICQLIKNPLQYPYKKYLKEKGKLKL